MRRNFTATPIITVDDIVVSEGNPFAIFTIRLSEGSATNVSVTCANFNNTALNGADYSAANQVVTFTPGQLVKTIQIAIINDAVAESRENFGLQLSSPVGGIIGGDGFAWATIVDNNAAVGTPAARGSDAVVDEADGRVSFVVTLDKPIAGAVTINFATANGTALAGADYVANSGTLIFAAGETAKTVIVDLINDGTQEGDERFNLLLSAPVGATLLNTTGTATVTANDALVVASPVVTVDDIVVSEADTFGEFVVRLNAPSASAVTVNYQTFNNTALNGSDFSGLVGSLRFEAGETSKVVKVPILNDVTAEGVENFSIGLLSATGATIGKPAALATIVDNDTGGGTPIVTLGDAIVDEKSGSARITVVLDCAPTSGVTVTLGTQAATTTSDVDYALQAGTKVVFAPGETAKTVWVSLTDEPTPEGQEIFDVAITAVTGATTGDGRGHVIVDRSDNATAVVPTISVGNVAGAEHDGFVEFKVMLSAPSAGKVSVNYSTANITALNGSDYNAVAGTLTFAPGETVRTVRIGLINDATAEAIETFNFNLAGAVGGVIGTATATATIIDDDSAAPASVAIAGTAQDDILRGAKFADVMTGGNGNDVLDGAAGTDSMTGGAGNDIYIVEEAGDTVVEGVGGGADKVISYITHTLGAQVEDLILGGTAAINGTGNAGNNIITGNAGANTLTGGAGNDIYVVDSVGDIVTELVNGGTDTVQSAINYVLGADVENLTITGAAAINGTGNTLANLIIGNAGNNVLDGGTGIDTVSYANAGAGVTVNLALAAAQNTIGAGVDTEIGFENLTGSNFNDTLGGNAAANVINGGTGADAMRGAAGDDTYIVDNLAVCRTLPSK